MKNENIPSVGHAQEQPPMQSVGSGELVRAEHLRLMTGQALAGMLANPEWMALAKEECKRPGCGHDVPKFFGELAAMYADRALTEADEISKLYSAKGVPHRG